MEMMKRIKPIAGLCFGLLLAGFGAAAQNATTEEILPYRSVDGYMVIRANVGGTEGDFLLDSRGKVCLTEAAAAVRNMKAEGKLDSYPRTGFEVVGKATGNGFFIGNTVYEKNISARIIRANPLLSKLKVDGVIGFSVFINALLTINAQAKTITLSAPYKPSYIKLINRDGAELIRADGNMTIDITVNGKTLKAIADFYEDQPLVLSAGDAEMIKPAKGATLQVTLAGISVKDVKAVKGNGPYTIVGRSLLSKGVISFDVSHEKYYYQGFNQGEEKLAPVQQKETIVFVPGKVNAIDRAYFLANVSDYKASKEWKTKGDKPVVIDFWATWCGPCMRMMPVMEELAAKYKDRVNFYKVNVDKEGELRDVFNATAIPLVIFGSLKDGATREIGADSKEKLEARILQLLQ